MFYQISIRHQMITYHKHMRNKMSVVFVCVINLVFVWAVVGSMMSPILVYCLFCPFGDHTSDDDVYAGDVTEKIEAYDQALDLAYDQGMKRMTRYSTKRMKRNRVVVVVDIVSLFVVDIVSGF